jgi:DNA-binding LacI/PurR family transcriptional regulator
VTKAAQRPVMHDVARLAGVSHQTVSRVLNAHPNVRAATRERVIVAMQQLNYRPNAFARGLVTKRSRRIGVMSFDSRMFGPGSTLRAIERAARAEGYGVAVASTSDLSVGDIGNAVEALDAQSVDGIIVIAPYTAAVRALGTLPRGLPIVALEAEYRPDLPVVSIDQFEGARLATQHLLDLGHETVWHVGGPSDWREALLRVDGWRATLAEASKRTPPLLHGDWSPRSGYAAGLELAPRVDVTAVFAGNDQMALGVIHALTKRGRRVPEDVSVVGFDDIPEAEFFLPGLTTVRQNFDEVGRLGLDLLVRILDDSAGVHRERPTIPPELVVRASTSAR